MCGIAGIVSVTDSTPDVAVRAALSKMVATMEHRGPDSRGVESFSRGCLGAARLAILGPEPASNQPMKSPISENVIVFNGEIYNYIELRSELETLGHRFLSTGDTEVLLHAFDEWGPECLPKLNGMFAFAVYNERSHALFFARDRFGVKPFYYALHDSWFVFASEPKAILSAGLASTTLDDHAVVDYLDFGITDASARTFFDQIKQLKAGQWGTVKNGEIETRTWYKVGVLQNASRLTPDRIEMSRMFRGLLQSSVQLRLRSDVPVALLLSGGLDSSAIAAMVSSLGHAEVVQAHNVSFPSSQVDESEFARAVARLHGISLKTETAESLSLESALDCVKSQQEPFISPSIIAQWLVMKAVHDSGQRVLLSGQGADEYLGGYEYFDAFAVLGWFRQGAFSEILRHVLNDRNIARAHRILLQSAILMMAAGVRPRWKHKPWLKLGHSDLGECDYYRDLLSCRGLPDALIFHVSRRLQELLRYEDRNSMSFSVETRQPFLDYRLVEFALSLPASDLVGAGQRKRVLREALATIVSPEVLARRDKIGFQTPDAWLLSPEFRDSFKALVELAPVPLRKYLDFAVLRQVTSRVVHWRRPNDLWRVFNLLLWYQVFIRNFEANKT